MKSQRILYYTAIFCLLAAQLLAENTNPVVTNVNHTYNSETGVVTITYDVTDAEQSSVTISMKVSNDGGTTYNYACTQISGAVGASVSTGNGKTITWTHDAEHGGPPSGSNFIIQIIANDETVGGDPCPGTLKVYYEGGPNNDGADYYNTIQIGDQCWLKENLNVGTMINGDTYQHSGNGIEKYCYDNNPDNCNTYGGLYEWAEAVAYTNGTTNNSPPVPAFSGNIQGICPNGWHIPTLAEFQILKTTVNDNGNTLKAVGQGFDSGTGTNTSGFSSLLSGFSHITGSFLSLGSYPYFWSSTEYATNKACDMSLYANYSNINLFHFEKYEGLSVRCAKD